MNMKFADGGLGDMTSEEFGHLFAQAGCQGWLYAADNDGDGEVSAGGDELAVAASVFKVAVALEVFTQAATGRLDPGQRIRVSPAHRTSGPTGLSVFADEAELSVRDLVLMMMAVSDNAATDILISLTGLDSVNATLASLGLRATVIPGTLREEIDSVGQDAGFTGWDDMTQASARFSAEDRRIQESILRARALTPEHAIRTTAREMATLLRLIWRDEAGPARACAQVRQVMALQVTRQRLALGFPRAGVKVAAKSGSLLGVIRNEVGVISLPDGGRYAVAVFTRANQPYRNEHEINAAIGAAAARAVESLRRR